MKETIKLYEDGEYKTYERDMAKIPLTVEDWMNANELDVAQHNYSMKTTSDKPMKAKDAQDLVKADVKFVVNYFRNQFTPDQAMKGIAPKVMIEEFNRWYSQSAGALDIGNEKGDQKK
jgi:hypothetical protein